MVRSPRDRSYEGDPSTHALTISAEKTLNGVLTAAEVPLDKPGGATRQALGRRSIVLPQSGELTSHAGDAATPPRGTVARAEAPPRYHGCGRGSRWPTWFWCPVPGS